LNTDVTTIGNFAADMVAKSIIRATCRATQIPGLLSHHEVKECCCHK